MKRIGKRLWGWIPSCLSVAVLCLVAPTHAGIVLGLQDWDTNPADGIGSWTTSGTDATLTLNTDNPEHNGLQITFSENVSPEPGGHWNETIYMPADDLFVGVWNTDMWISFNFWAETTAPTALEIRPYGDTTGRELPSPVVGQWTQFTAPLANWEQWSTNPFGSAEDFLNDLESINWIGVYVEHCDDADQEIYGMDNVALMGSEPGEVVLLLAGLAAVYGSCRKRHALMATA